MDERVYLQLQLLKSYQTDEDGNYLVWAEASNENLDVERQRVLQRALMDSASYFLKNGVISYDHRHLKADPNDPNWNPEKYIIGKPVEVKKRGLRTFVRSKLYKSNKIVQEIIGKLRDKAETLKTSVGGKWPQVEKAIDERGRKIENVVRVLWDEMAITFKPVNQTLAPVGMTPADFVKSLEMGAPVTDSAKMTGGRAMVPQDLEGARLSKHVSAVVNAMAYGDVQDENGVRRFLKGRGCSSSETDQIISHLVKNRTRIGKGVPEMEDTLKKAVDDSIASLEAALSKSAKGKDKEPPEDELPPSEPPEEEEEEVEEQPEAPRGRKSQPDGERPSLYDKMRETDPQVIDASRFLNNLVKSISEELADIRKSVEAGQAMSKAIGTATLVNAQMLKAFGEQPARRQGAINVNERTFKGEDGKTVSMTPDEIRAKLTKAIQTGAVTFNDLSKVEDMLARRQPIPPQTLALIKSLP
jgi:hypothetical protein